MLQDKCRYVIHLRLSLRKSNPTGRCLSRHILCAAYSVVRGMLLE